MTEAEVLCDRIALIHAGKILAVGPKAELFRTTGAENLVDAFLALVQAEEKKTA